MTQTAWEIEGSESLPLLGLTDQRSSRTRVCAVIVHGFKGYKEYGMFPAIASALADAGAITHRFNLAHSGMTNETDSFAREDLFERDTWSNQVEDVRAVIRAVRSGALAGTKLPIVLIGHSRGGVTSMLSAGRHADELNLAGVVTINAPATCNSLTDAQRASLLEHGFLETYSARTGQALRVGAAWLRDQLDHPEEHDLERQASQIACPILVIQGEADDVVHPDAARVIAASAGQQTTVALIPNGNHVLNTPNPHPSMGPHSGELTTAISAITKFVLDAASPNA